MRFDVYGRFVVEVERRGGGWVAFTAGGDGKRRGLPDVPLPDDLAEDDMARHLADVFHEYSAPGLEVRRVDDAGG